MTLPCRASRLHGVFRLERVIKMMNVKSYLLYTALAACLGTGYGAHYLVARNDSRPLDLRSVECEDTSGKPTLDKTQRPLATGGDF